MINININPYPNTGYAPQQTNGFAAFGGFSTFTPASQPSFGTPMAGGGCGCPCSGGFAPSHELMQGGGFNGMQGFVPMSGFGGQDPFGNGLAGMAGLGAMMGGMMGALRGLLPGMGDDNAQVPKTPEFGSQVKKLQSLLKKGKGKGKKAQKAQAAAFRQIRTLLTGPNGIF